MIILMVDNTMVDGDEVLLYVVHSDGGMHIVI